MKHDKHFTYFALLFLHPIFLSMLTTTLIQLFTRDLTQLKTELLAYHDEKNIWRVSRDIKNSAGNLCLHLAGNLNTYIGAQMGKSGYTRNRELEFSQRNVPRDQLVRMIEDTILMIDPILNQSPASSMEEEHPFLVFDKKTSVEFLLIHLATHLAYHLGQVNYHRRLLDHE